MDAPRALTLAAGGSWFQRKIGRRAYDLAGLAEPFCRGARWLPSAVSLGAGPFLVSLWTGWTGHQFVSAALLAWTTSACARRDAWAKGMALVSVAFIAHSAAVIWASCQMPDRSASVVADGAEYWQKQVVWIETGSDPEYDPLVWIPNHLALLGGSTLWSVFSLGLVTFQRGFYEVDLMNYYNGRLLLASDSRPLALLLGWHLWSLLRGAGYVVLTFELISAGLYFWSGVAISTWGRRAGRWAAGLSLLVADGVVKFHLLGPVRDALFEIATFSALL